VAAGQHPAVVAMLGEQRDGLIDRIRPMILEPCWDHLSLPIETRRPFARPFALIDSDFLKPTDDPALFPRA
jgi:hypothetical protein